jgi:hypothetical protein
VANLYYDFAGTRLTPELPVDREEQPLADTLDMAPGNRRHYARPTRRRVTWTLRYGGADEAMWATWRTVAQAAELSVAMTEPDGSAFTVKTLSFSDTPIATTITSGSGTTSAVGTITRDLVLTVESL